MGWIRKTTAIAAIVAAAGLTAGAAVQSAATGKDKEKAAGEKDRQVRIIDRVGPEHGILALGGGPRLGVALREATADKAAASGGAVVAEVDENSPAAKAGLQSDDVIVEFDGERVRGVRQLQRLVSETPAGRPVKLVVTRDGKRIDLTATLEERDWPQAFAFDRQKLDEDVRRGVEEGMRGMREFRFEHPDEQAPGDVVPKERERWNFRVEPRWPMFQWSEGAGRLGVTVQELGEQLRDHFGADHGVLVASVSPESAAARGGLKAGDVITTVSGKKIETTAELVGAVRAADEGAEVEIGIVRDRKPQTVKVKLSEGGSRAKRTWTI